jgi:hypothetical protein
MVIDMNDEQMHTLAQMQAFLDGTVAVELALALAIVMTYPPLSTWLASIM